MLISISDPWETCQLVQDYDASSFKAQTQEVRFLYVSLLTEVPYNNNLSNPFRQGFSLLSWHRLCRVLPTPHPTSSMIDIRINVFWFTSLSLGLTMVLLGTTCMQWLREYRHHDSLTYIDALLLRHMRYERFNQLEGSGHSLLAPNPCSSSTRALSFYMG